jgi:hypothetical protein
MELMRRITKYTRQDYKTSEGTLSKFKTNPVVKKIQSYGNKWIKHVRRMDRDRLPHLIVKYQQCGKRSQRTTPQKTSRQLMGPEQVRRPKTMQAKW